jgi:hypothetical protein
VAGVVAVPVMRSQGASETVEKLTGRVEPELLTVMVCSSLGSLPLWRLKDSSLGAARRRSIWVPAKETVIGIRSGLLETPFAKTAIDQR